MNRKIVAFLLVLSLLLCACADVTEPYPFEIVCFDVGQGDSTLLRTAGGDILVDAGTEASQSDLCRRLRALGVEELLLVIFTHPDEDHIGGGDGILKEFGVKEVWVNGSTEENESVLRLREAMNAAQLSPKTVTSGDYFSVGNVNITVLAPLSDNVADDNEGSIVLAICFGVLSFLMMGDAGEETEEALLQIYDRQILQADLLHVGHHGSNTSGSIAFLEVVCPRYALISCGAGNPYGHPDGRVLARLEKVGAEIRRTDLLGELHICADESGTLFWSYPLLPS